MNGHFNSMTIKNKKLLAGMSDMNELSLPNGATIDHQIGIDFNDTTQPAQIELMGNYIVDVWVETWVPYWRAFSFNCSSRRSHPLHHDFYIL